MTDLSKDDVLKALAAAEFAAAFLLYLDVLVTLDFGGMGITAPKEAHSELKRFLKAMNSWLGERTLPVAWIACIERSTAGSLHAHIAVHVPGMRRADGKLHGVRYRTEFRRWARGAIARKIGATVPRLVNVRCSLLPSLIAHWISVTYLLKGYDRGAVLVGERNSWDGAELRLGDILPFPYRAPAIPGLIVGCLFLAIWALLAGILVHLHVPNSRCRRRRTSRRSRFCRVEGLRAKPQRFTGANRALFALL